MSLGWFNGFTADVVHELSDWLKDQDKDKEKEQSHIGDSEE